MQPEPVPQTSSTTQAIPESEAIARDIKDGNLGGFVGNNTHLTGDASFKGMMRVDGHLSGRISSGDGTLIVSTNGLVDADISVATAKVYGTVKGDITATTLIELGRTARVTGNILTPSLIIENGATFDGACRMSPAAGGATTGRSNGTSK
ncbi:MAG: polymer-forming cytoskeletal protein [Pyrinomonadaceae bacterium]